MSDIFDRIGGLLSNPVVQGVGRAAATGFNPLVGLLAAPDLMNERERKQLELQEARNAIKVQDRMLAAQEALPGLLAERSTVELPGMELMGIEGDPIAQLSGPRVSVPAAINTAEGQARAFGLLGDLSPGVGAQGLLQALAPKTSGERKTSLERNIEAATDPTRTPEQRQLFLDALKKETDDESTLQSIQTLQAQLALEQMQRDREKEETDARKQRIGLENSIRNSVMDVQDLSALNRKLNDGLLRSGLPMPQTRRDLQAVINAGSRMLGKDTTKADEELANFDKFNKGLNDLILTTIDRFKDSGQMTNDKLRLLRSASATTYIEPAAIASILSNIAELNLQAAAAEGIELENADELRELIRADRNFTMDREEPATEGAAPGGGARRFRYNPQTGQLEPQ